MVGSEVANQVVRSSYQVKAAPTGSCSQAGARGEGRSYCCARGAVAAARESTTGSSSRCDEELKSEYPFLDILHKPCTGFWPYTLQSYSVGERDQALQDCAQLRGFNADLEGYNKTVVQQLKQADRKIAEQLQTILKLNRDKDQRDEEIFN